MQEGLTEATNDICFYYRTSEIWDAMYADCIAAQTSIEFEQYIIMDDRAGGRFLDLFAQKAAEGVKVRLLFDGVGSRGILFSPQLDKIRKAGGEVHFYNPLHSYRVLNPRRWLPRSHVKTMLIDGRIAHTGSACLWEIMEHWHELHCRFTGNAVNDVVRHFSSIWETEKKDEKIKGTEPADMNMPTGYAVSAPALHTNPIYKQLLMQIRAAQSSVRLVTPYFLPPHRLRRALINAARRGVKVEILMSAKTDVPLADHVSHSYFPGLLRHGIQLFLYPSQVLHAKYAIIDDTWATVGSTNMDYLSLLKNREANLIIRDAAALAKLRDGSDVYMRDAARADMTFVQGIPWTQRLAGYLGRFMKEVL